jgi:hypothetical protein
MLKKKELMADFRDRCGDGYPGGSRDFWCVEVQCKCSDCICNSGHGTCAVPSRAIVGGDGKCEGYLIDKNGDPVDRDSKKSKKG